MILPDTLADRYRHHCRFAHREIRISRSTPTSLAALEDRVAVVSGSPTGNMACGVAGAGRYSHKQ
jgi:hypothetical protein